jgi:hypothetical protein
MRVTFVLTVVLGLVCSFASAQQVQPGQQNQFGQQPNQVNPGRTVPGQPGQLQPGQQQPGQLQPGQFQQGQQGHQGQAAHADQQIAAVIYGCCHNEVQTAKFAESRLQSQQAKEFAEKMVKDHSPECEVYQKFAGNLAAAQPNNRGGQQMAGQLDWLAIHQQIGQRCLESTEKELSQQKSDDVDACFIGSQLKGHMEMKDKLTVLKQYASQPLAQQIDKSLEGVESHLKAARQVMEQLKDYSTERVSRRSESNR